MDVKYSPSLVLSDFGQIWTSWILVEFGQNPRWLQGIKHSHIVQKMVSKYFHADFFIDHFQILYND
jgi:hypothetical protein